jgi:hypothetical protein
MVRTDDQPAGSHPQGPWTLRGERGRICSVHPELLTPRRGERYARHLAPRRTGLTRTMQAGTRCDRQCRVVRRTIRRRLGGEAGVPLLRFHRHGLGRRGVLDGWKSPNRAVGDLGSGAQGCHRSPRRFRPTDRSVPAEPVRAACLRAASSPQGRIAGNGSWPRAERAEPLGKPGTRGPRRGAEPWLGRSRFARDHAVPVGAGPRNDQGRSAKFGGGVAEQSEERVNRVRGVCEARSNHAISYQRLR